LQFSVALSLFKQVERHEQQSEQNTDTFLNSIRLVHLHYPEKKLSGHKRQVSFPVIYQKRQEMREGFKSFIEAKNVLSANPVDLKKLAEAFKLGI
jgi:hypothetical protein